MALKNTHQSYGWVSRLLHWVMAVAFISMYGVGSYMVDLTYYDPLYHTLPDWHKSVGIVLVGLFIVRLIWTYSQPRPQPVTSPAPAYTHTLAKLGHLALYGLLAVIFSSGYLISTAEGHGIWVFDWVEIPAILAESKARGELAGDVHEIVAGVFMVLVGIHAVAALVHHFYWKDATLTRMLGKAPSNHPHEQ